MTWSRPGWGPEYCCLTNADYVALFHDGIYSRQELALLTDPRRNEDHEERTSANRFLDFLRALRILVAII